MDNKDYVDKLIRQRRSRLIGWLTSGRYTYFWVSGIYPWRRGITKDPRRWGRYLCWWLYQNLSPWSGPRLVPDWATELLKRMAARIWTERGQAVYITGRKPDGSIRTEPTREWRPSEGGYRRGRFIVDELLKRGPLTRWRRRLHVQCRKISGFGHRCEFTNPGNGYLFGGPGCGADAHFEAFAKSLGPTPEQCREIESAVEGLRSFLRGDLVN